VQALQGSLHAEQCQALHEQMEGIEQELCWLQGELGRQQEYALAAFSDLDYVKYCQEQLQVRARFLS